MPDERNKGLAAWLRSMDRRCGSAAAWASWWVGVREREREFEFFFFPKPNPFKLIQIVAYSFNEWNMPLFELLFFNK